MLFKKMENPKKREKDNCVLCGRETPYYKDEHIDTRYHYIEGAGQLCKECCEHCDGLRYYTSPNTKG
jgi:hypothetical protein